jgi:hypothetical protein
MASLDFLQVREARKSGAVGFVRGVDNCVAIRLRYKGTGSVTSVTVTTAVDITIVTTDGGTDVYEFATYTTVGALVDQINLDGIFEAKVLDTLRSKATASQFLDGAISEGTYFGETVWDVLVDTSAADYIAFRLTYDRGFVKPSKNNHRVHLKEVSYLINLSGATASTVTIYDCNYEMGYPKEEIVAFKAATVDNSVTTINWRSGVGNLTVKEGHDILVLIPDADNFTHTSAWLKLVGFIE